MKRIFDRLFGQAEPEIDPQQVEVGQKPISSELTHSDIETYYLRVITDSLRRMLVRVDGVEIAVKRVGAGKDGLPAFTGYVRLLRWDSVMTPVLLQNLPVIDARVRRVVAASVLLENTRFAGLWFQATEETAGAPTGLVGMPAELIHQAGWPASP